MIDFGRSVNEFHIGIDLPSLCIGIMSVEKIPETVRLRIPALPLVHSVHDQSRMDTVDDKENYTAPCQWDPDLIRVLFDQLFQPWKRVLDPKQSKNASEEAVGKPIRHSDPVGNYDGPRIQYRLLFPV